MLGGLLLVVAGAWLWSPANIDYLQDPSFGPANEALWRDGWFGAWPGPVHAHLLPVGHFAVFLVGDGFSPLLLAGLAMVGSVFCALRANKNGLWTAASMALAVVAMASIWVLCPNIEPLKPKYETPKAWEDRN